MDRRFTGISATIVLAVVFALVVGLQPGNSIAAPGNSVFQEVQKSEGEKAGDVGFELSADGGRITLDWGEKPTSGYAIDIDSMERAAGVLKVYYTLRSPGPGEIVLQVITHPRATAEIPAEYIPFTAVRLVEKGPGNVEQPGAGEKGKTVVFEYKFADGAEGWSGGFADLPADYDPSTYELQFACTNLPAELDSGKKGLFISGHNRSDDLFMFIKRKLDKNDGIKPNTTYRVQFEIDMATNVPAGLVGIGGAPGESVYVKAGAATIEPLPVIRDPKSGSPFYEMNIDKGQQACGGRDAIIIGNVAKAGSGDDNYQIKTLDNLAQPFEITTDEGAKMWLLVGTDSGFEGLTSLYYTGIRAKLTEMQEQEPSEYKKLTVTPCRVNLKQNKTKQLKVALLPKKGRAVTVTESAQYQSSNPDVVKVERGKLTAVSKGNAEVTVWHKGFSRTIKVRVK